MASSHGHNPSQWKLFCRRQLLADWRTTFYESQRTRKRVGHDYLQRTQMTADDRAMAADDSKHVTEMGRRWTDGVGWRVWG